MVDPNYSGAINVIQPKTTLFSTIKTLHDHANPTVIHDLYVNKSLSVKQVAELTGASKGAILANLKRFDIPTRAAHQSHGRPGNPPYGYHLVGGRLVSYAKEQRVIKLVRKMFVDQGATLSAIVRHLTAAGIPTKKSRSPWHHEMIRSILKRERLI